MTARRYRLRFTKMGKIRFLGHRDVARCWERAIRRAELPIVYSEGFSPRPRVHFGLALPTSAESLAEYIDIDLLSEVQPMELSERLDAHMPPGISVVAAVEVPRSTEALQAAVQLCRWRLRWVDAPEAELVHAVESLRASDQCEQQVERKGKVVTMDLRPSITDLDLRTGNDGVMELFGDLSTKPRGVRPAELARALGLGDYLVDVRRINQWMNVDGQRCEPIPLPTEHACGSAR